MQEGFICKDCNYSSDTEGNCPYCDMPMEPIDGVDETTGEVDKYKKDDIGNMDKEEDNGGNGEEILAKDDLDELIDSKDEDEEFLEKAKKENEEFHKKEEK